MGKSCGEAHVQGRLPGAPRSPNTVCTEGSFYESTALECPAQDPRHRTILVLGCASANVFIACRSSLLDAAFCSVMMVLLCKCAISKQQVL